mmetsp:Transcript_53484/g.148258  ORF Transcript_53484/g.148258 Transcript_53484/m.148258 type:complete len:695 (-) Transcript_53484:35-2119(-)
MYHRPRKWSAPCWVGLGLLVLMTPSSLRGTCCLSHDAYACPGASTFSTRACEETGQPHSFAHPPPLFPKPSTHDGALGRVGDEPLHLALRPARAEGPVALRLSALPRSTARVLKAQLRWRCRGLAPVPDERIRLLYRGVELPDDSPIGQHVPSQGDGPFDLQFLVLDGQECSEECVTSVGLCISEGVPCPPELEAVALECEEAMRRGVEPKLATGGTGGTYFLRSDPEGPALAVFKPKDEEANAPQNPWGYEGLENSRGVRPGVPSAHRAVREVAAHLLDHQGFAGVPMTTLAHGRHRGFQPLRGSRDVVWKVGALQAFVNTSETADNFGPGLYSTRNVHRLAILDMRIANFDRNCGNILVKTKHYSDGSWSCWLVPIDHGCSLPDRLGICCSDVVWTGWPQVRQPLGGEELRYIAQLDGRSDAQLLAERLGLERDGLRLLEVLTRWLQIAAPRAQSLHEVASALYRTDPAVGEELQEVEPSAVERIVRDCLDSALAGSGARAVVPRPGSALGTPGLQRSITVKHTPVQVRSGDVPKDGIFSRRDQYTGRELEWAPRLEELFRRHVDDAFERLVRAWAPAAQGWRPPSACGMTHLAKGDADSTARVATRPAPSHSKEVPGLEALVDLGTSETSVPIRGADVPPHLLRKQPSGPVEPAAGPAAEATPSEEAEAPGLAVLPPRSKGAYVPPHLRRK